MVRASRASGPLDLDPFVRDQGTTMLLSFPSGLCGDARTMKGKDIFAIANRMKDEDVLDEGGMTTIIGGCWQQTTAPGPYPFAQAGSAIDWSRILAGDVLSGLVRVRVASFGERGRAYSFFVRCEDAGCRKRFEWEIDLERDVLARERKLGEAGFESVRTGQPLVAKVGRVSVSYRLQTMALSRDVGRFRRLQQQRGTRKPEVLVTQDAMAAQLVAIDGRPVNGIERAWNWLGELDAGALLELQEQMDEADCGLDTKITTQCVHCGWEQDVLLPFQRTFLVPKSRTNSQTKSETTTTEEPEEDLPLP
jgi:hypothetical protein